MDDHTHLRRHSFSSSPPAPSSVEASFPSKPKPRPKPEPATPSSAIPPCTECGKRFASWKALFGHMRCHPERPYRGINPPPGHAKPLLCLPPDARFTEDEYDVARSLVLLANGPKRAGAGAASVPEVYACSSCMRVFGSPQALGRHRASHRSGEGKRKRCVWDLNLPPPPAESGGVGGLASSSSAPGPGLELKLGI